VTHPQILPGNSHPLGATVHPTGVNFSVFAKECDAVELLLFDTPDAPYPRRVIALDPKRNRSFHFWHCFVEGLGAGQIYAYRVYGKFEPKEGLRFDGTKVLLDPYALGIANWDNYSRRAASLPGDNCAQALRGVVIDPDVYDWDGDKHPRIPYAESIIYEMHVKGFTKSPSSGVTPERRGTFAGVIEKIPYLKELGITAVELLPVHTFDEQDAPLGLHNYWGYSTVNFFVPHVGYSSTKNPALVLDEFRDMVKALHAAGIEVILDVVYNHTAEGTDEGPTISYRGFSNDTYYILDPDKKTSLNFSGCGNSFNGNHPIVNNIIMDSLRYWATEMHVDGFRFDLASVLMRDLHGNVMERPYVLWSMECDSGLAGAKLIAEAWDAVGLYSVGWFINRQDYFAEWNGPFRDDVRRFVTGGSDTVRHVAARMLGSSDIYVKPDRDPNRSINFVTCHDGFTLNDLVSYNYKHNEANLEDSRDGANDNISWNCGIEGPTADAVVEKLRLRQIKNLFTILMLSQGTPMMTMGDEVRRTQHGNNNAYGHDSELSWFDWTLCDENKDLLRFVQKLVRYSESFALFSTHTVISVASNNGDATVFWHGTKLNQPDWGENSHTLAFTLQHPRGRERMHFMLSSYWESLKFDLPPNENGHRWHVLIDTSCESPNDIYDVLDAPMVMTKSYEVTARSVVIVLEKPTGEQLPPEGDEEADVYNAKWFL